ncbi:MAG: hypothetical protein O9267_07890, partial [Flavobacterium sp.]|nr:hypothetical protein [Flavobacterium sp.]
MKLSKEFENGGLLFLGIGILFIVLELLGLSTLYYLRGLNFLIVVYFLNRQIKYNISVQKKGFYQNFFSCCITGFIGISLG